MKLPATFFNQDDHFFGAFKTYRLLSPIKHRPLYLQCGGLQSQFRGLRTFLAAGLEDSMAEEQDH